jgi:hypothetical protein
MRFERVAVSEQPVWLCGIPYLHTGQLLQNTGSTEVLVGIVDDDLAADNALKVTPGETITWPNIANVPVDLYAVSPGGVGEITYTVLQG